MINFPLYDTLISKNTTKRDITKKQKVTLVENLKKLDSMGQELVYVLIRIYELKNEEKDMSNYKLPYNGEYKDSDLTFNLEEFPKPLKRMLHEFCKMHLKTMKEDSKRM